MDVKPLRVAGVSHAMLGVTAVVLGVGVWVDDFAPWPVAGALTGVLVGSGVLIAVRSLRMAVECRNGMVTVRGLVLTRVVPQERVDGVTDFPALRWRDAEGRRRWTPIVFFMDSPRALTSVGKHNARELDRLRRWIGSGGS